MVRIYEKEYTELNYDDIKGKVFGFIYVTINNLNSMKYVGLHYKWRRGYLGSGNYFLSTVRKYGRENFTRYIIDTADSYEEPIQLEAHYITEEFGINTATSKDWYNITSGLQRGGNTWAGMTEADKAKRVAKLVKHFKGKKHTEEQIEKNRKATSERMQDPKEREKIAKATKKAMANPEVRKRISEAKKGTHVSAEAKEAISKTTRSHFKITLKGKVLCEDLNVSGSYDGACQALSEMLGVKIGRKLFIKLVKTEEVYEGRKLEIHGLQIERIG